MTELKPGDPAPDFTLTDADEKEWTLSDLRGEKVILYFYPIDDTPGCTAQACDFRDAKRELDEAGYRVFGVSPQDAESHRAFRDKYDLNFPLLVDADQAVAHAYGTGASEERPLIKRSTFIIDENGIVTEARYGVRGQGHVETLRVDLGI
ncbi:MAG TPA: peroxiredoxin [Actinomycetota bacterium]|nr:peroxiredoxin [Actinomycetota bacterium]